MRQANALGLQWHHWAIANSFGRHAGGGINRLAQAGWNLIPLTARLNRAIGNGGYGFNTVRGIVASSPFFSAAAGYGVGTMIRRAGSGLWELLTRPLDSSPLHPSPDPNGGGLGEGTFHPIL